MIQSLFDGTFRVLGVEYDFASYREVSGGTKCQPSEVEVVKLDKKRDRDRPREL